MAAYVVLIRDNPPHDLSEMEKYSAKSRERPPDPKLKVLALYGAMEALEPNTTTSISHFSSNASASK